MTPRDALLPLEKELTRYRQYSKPVWKTWRLRVHTSPSEDWMTASWKRAVCELFPMPLGTPLPSLRRVPPFNPTKIILEPPFLPFAIPSCSARLPTELDKWVLLSD